MKIDISFMDEQSCVIWCRTKEEAVELMHNVVSKYPKTMRGLAPKVERFKTEKDDEGLGFRFDCIGEDDFDIGYGSMYYYRDAGYKIIEFNDLLIMEDYGDFDSGFLDVVDALSILF